MGQYKRIISYIYSYKHGDKGGNVGYARIEKIGGKCRITIQVRGVPVFKLPEVDLYRQISTGVDCLGIGKMFSQAGGLQFKYESDVDNISQRGYGIDDFDGLIIPIFDDDSEEASNNRQVCVGKNYLATSWKNDSIYIGEPVKIGERKADNSENIQTSGNETTVDSDKNGNRQESEQDKYTDDVEDEYKDTMENNSETMEKTEEQTENREADKEVIENDEEISDENMETEETDDSEYKNVISNSDIEMTECRQKSCKVCPLRFENDKSEEYGKKMLGRFPLMYPFVEGEVMESVRIEPKDIGCLPIKYWAIANNKFLLNGYYRYKHLLFALLYDGKYAVGVPGIYCAEECNMARMHSFQKFVPIGSGKKERGVFGYWFYIIN